MIRWRWLTLVLVPLLSACDRSTDDVLEPAPSVSDSSANNLMGLAENAAADAHTLAERNQESARSETANEQQGDRQ